MATYQDDKTIYEHDMGHGVNFLKVTFVPGLKNISIVQSLRAHDLDQEQAFQMIREIAAHYGKDVEFKDHIEPCPNCGGKDFEYQITFPHGKDGLVWKNKVCTSCGLAGPGAKTEKLADEDWQRMFFPDTIRTNIDHPTTIKEDAARR